jgi:arginyl-tRNA synthetase
MLTTILLAGALSVFQIAAHPDIGGAKSPVALRSAAQVRTAPRQLVQDTYSSITRKIAIANIQKHDTCRTNFSLEKTWQDATIVLMFVSLTNTCTSQQLTDHTVSAVETYHKTIRFKVSRASK